MARARRAAAAGYLRGRLGGGRALTGGGRRGARINSRHLLLRARYHLHGRRLGMWLLVSPRSPLASPARLLRPWLLLLWLPVLRCHPRQALLHSADEAVDLGLYARVLWGWLVGGEVACENRQLAHSLPACACQEPGLAAHEAHGRLD